MVERLNRGDIDGIVALSASIGWDYAPPELETALAAGVMVGCRAADGTLVACAGLFAYGDRLTSLGLVMVRPDHQGQGLGKRVTLACMAEAGDRPIILAATDEGEPLYARLGFETVSTLHKLIAPAYRAIETPAAPLGPAPDFEAFLALDIKAFGAPRTAFLQARLAQSDDQAWCYDAAGHLVGFALAVPGPVVCVIGPVVAPDAASALAMIDALARRRTGALRIDIPSTQTDLVAAMVARGFALNRVPPVMAYRTDLLPPRNGALYAIAAQAYG